MKSAMPGDMYRVFMHYKRDEWERFIATVTDWDVRSTSTSCPRPGASRNEDAMCGIAGIIHRDGTTDIGPEMTAMLQSMKHRGPDSTGFALTAPGATCW